MKSKQINIFSDESFLQHQKNNTEENMYEIKEKTINKMRLN